MMRQRRYITTFFIIAIVFALSFGNSLYSQTVVQWYTSMGDFRAQLREDLVPVTAQNFIDLSNANFYDDLIFHRVIIEFMIQDGCPNGNGSGGPGYSFDDEFHPDLRHDEPGILSMANSGPNTNGSQYFITVVPTTWLDDLHAVFGKIIDGMDVVYAISEVETNSNDKPLIDVVIDSIRVVTGDPQVIVTAPLPATKLNGSIENEITWDSEFIADVKIEFSSNNGSSWTDIVESTSANTRSYTWPAPNISSSECLIKISDVANPSVFDITDASFTLCELDLIVPNGFGFYRVGSTVEINWESELVGDITLAYKSSFSGEWVTIEEGVPASNNSFIWIPEIATNWCKVSIKEDSFPDVYDESDNQFIVFQLDLTAPTGGESLAGESLYEITWESEIISSVNIEFSSDNGLNWSTVSEGTTAGNSVFEWTVPNINSNECYIKLTTPGLDDLFSINETAFSIDEFTGISDQSQKSNFDLTISPNPVLDEALILYSINKNNLGSLKVEIYNAQGEMVYMRDLRDNKPGDHLLKLDLPELPNGLYVVKLGTNKDHTSRKFIKK